MCHLPDKLLRGNPRLPELTIHGGPCATVPSGGRDELDFYGTWHAPHVPPPLFPTAIRDKASRTALSRVTSRARVKVRFLDFGKGVWITPVFRLDVIHQSGQGGSGTSIADNPLPGGITVQLGEQLRHLRNQFLPLRRRKISDRPGDFLNCVPGDNLTCRRSVSKPCFLSSNRRSTLYPLPRIQNS